MKKLIAVLLLAAFIQSCGMVEVKETDSLTFNEHMRLGAIYENQGKYELALREYESAQVIDTREANACFALGNVYLRLKDFPRAERHYRRAIELEPKPEFYNNMGWLLMEKGDMKGALKSVEEAVRMATGGGYIYLDTLGVVQMRAGELGKAEKSFLDAAGAVPAKKKDALFEIYGHLSELYKKTGQKQKAAVMDEKINVLKTPEAGEGL
ncbi:MAG: hypothetical protein A2054_04380 [Deltaproteobacteria bacterium GWA2_55_10]|nr:MAG: hypothetical protein A2054_04380 [Deltaproteobacteria bacterium GWA2_55_10]